MSIHVRIYKTFEYLADAEAAKYLNKGDVFLPDNTGWEFEVVKKVCFKIPSISSNGKAEYGINVLVKPLSKGARKYAKNKDSLK